MIIKLRAASKKLMLSAIIFLLFVYVTVLLCSIPSNYTVKYENGKLIPSHIGVFIIKDTNEKFVSLLKLDLGRTGKDNKSLNYLITDLMKNTLMLLFGGLLLATILGIAKGILDSKRGSPDESSLRVLGTIIPISLPDILIIALLQRFAIFLYGQGIEIFKVGGGGTINHLFLPIITLSILPACYIARITSMAIDNCYQQEYIKVAIGKGSSSYRVLWIHVMKNAIPSIIDSLPTITAIIIGNLLMVEKLFSFPGLTQSLLNFFEHNDRDGVVANIILIGIIYFIIDALFSLLKWIVVKPLKEESI